MKYSAAFAVLLAAAPALAADPAAKRAVDVRASGTEDALTTRFVEAIRTALPAAERLRAQTPEEDDDLSLLVSNAAPDGKKFTWAADLLKVNAGFTPTRVGSFVGKCRTDELADCAKGIVTDSDKAVRKAEKD